MQIEADKQTTMKSLDQKKSCPRCGTDLSGNDCPECGHTAQIQRIDKQYVLSEISEILNFDKGIFYTLRELLLRPGLAVRKFLLEDRTRLVKPVSFIIISSLAYMFFEQFFHYEGSYIDVSSGSKNVVTVLVSWMQNNYGYANILMSVFIAIWIKLFFKKFRFNLYEILVLLFYLLGTIMLIYTVFGIFESLTGIRVLPIAGVVGILYFSWAIGQFFNNRKIASFIKGIAAYILGMVTFAFSLVGVGLFIEWIRRSIL